MALAVIQPLAELMNVSLNGGNDLQTQLNTLIDHNVLGGKLHERSLRSLQQGMPQHWFDSRVNQLKKRLSRCLPTALVDMLEPRQIWNEQKQLLLDINELGEAQPAESRNKNGFYGIALQPEQFIFR